MTRVLLIRHGETLWNRDRRWQGHADVPLSDQGREQAQRLAAFFKGEMGERVSLQAVYSSDLLRAVDTARELACAVGADLVLDRAWREIDVGCWTGLCLDEIRERFADEWRRIGAGEDLPRGGGESFSSFSSRILLRLDELRERHAGQGVAVVTHGGAIRAVLLHALGLPWQRLREVEAVANTAVNEIRWQDGAWRIERRNDTVHLAAWSRDPR